MNIIFDFKKWNSVLGKNLHVKWTFVQNKLFLILQKVLISGFNFT